MKSAKNLCNNNQQRVRRAGEECHAALSQMDIGQFNTFSKTETGQAMMFIANEFANRPEEMGMLKTFEIGMYD
jgi:hypothetical protein